MTKKRLVNLIIFLGLVGIEVLIALFVHDNFIRPFVGDVIVVAVVYYFVRIFFPVGVKWLALYVFIFATGLEFLQLWGVTRVLSFDNRFLQTLLGATFSVWDIVCYAIGCAVVGLVAWLTGRKHRRDKEILP